MKEIKPLMFIAILCVSSMMAFLAVVGPIIRKLNLQEWHAGLMVAIAGIAWVFLARFWGKKSDIFGRKRVLVFVVLGFFISYLFLSLYVNYALINPPLVMISLITLILARLFIGVFYSGIPPVMNALIADKIDTQNRTSYMARLGAANGIGMILGPILGGALASYGLASSLYAASLLPLIALFIVLYYLKEEDKIEKIQERTTLSFFDKRLRIQMFASFVIMFSIVTSQVCLGFFILDKFKLDEIQSAKDTGYVLAIIGVVFIFSQVFVSKLKKVKAVSLLLLACTLATLGYFLVGFVSNLFELILAFCIGVFGLGILMPSVSALTANSVSDKEQGIAAGTISSVQGIGIIIGPLVSTLLYKLSPETPFLFTSFTFLVLLIMAFFYKEQLNK